VLYQAKICELLVQLLDKLGSLVLSEYPSDDLVGRGVLLLNDRLVDRLADSVSLNLLDKLRGFHRITESIYLIQGHDVN